MTLLNVLSKRLDLSLIVAHFDHGIRADSAQDAEFVRTLAARYNLPFELGHGSLGKNASEALAREKRYEFLNAVQKKHGATAIITAHHQDDLVETALINTLRGTSRLGLSSLKSSEQIKRPLLNIKKQEILNYARVNHLEWHEDSTNVDVRYLRNRIRQLLKTVGPKDLGQIAKNLQFASYNNEEMDRLLKSITVGYVNGKIIERNWFIALPHDISREVVALWLRKQLIEFDRRDIARLVRIMKTAKNGTVHDVDKTHVVMVDNKQISLQTRSSV